MTTTIAPFREADVLRDVAGKFSGKAQTAPELTLEPASEFDLATFMQEPPTEPVPFEILQPVIYTDVAGEDVHGTIVGFTDDGWPTLMDRTRGTLSETGDIKFTVDPRYVRPDDEVSLDAVRRQRNGLAAGIEAATQLAALPDEETIGIDSYINSLHVRDRLSVDGRKDWAETYMDTRRQGERALDDLVHRDLLNWEAASWTNLEGGSAAPQEFEDVSNAFDSEGFVVARGALTAKMLDSFGEWTHIDGDTSANLTAAVDGGRELGNRMRESGSATEPIDTEVDAVGLNDAEKVFGGHVAGLPARKGAAYRKAVEAANTAFDALARYNLLDPDQRTWTKGRGSATTDDAILVRAAGQAAILRHFQPETGLGDAQLDAISTVFDGAVKKWAKSAA